MALLSYLHKSLKMAFKNVFSNLGQYAVFFAAILIIQVFFGSLTVILYNNDLTEWERVEEEYTYHVVVRNLNESQELWMENSNATVIASSYRVIDTWWVEEYYDEFEDESTFDLYIYLKGSDTDTWNEEFDILYDQYLVQLNRLSEDGSSLTYEKTPLLNFDTNMLYNRIIYIIAMIALVVLSVFLLVVLYNIRINHYKFIYGIYMSFGADFKKLFETAFWEMFSVASVTFLPATGISILISYLLFTYKGLEFSCPIWTLILTAVYCLIVILAAVWFPMRVMATKWPNSLINAEDNSNLVSSPRRSFDIFGTKFPFQYEVFSTWRFRTYNLRLLVSAVIFTSLFICGLYVAEITRVTLSNEDAQFEIDMSDSILGFSEDARDELYQIEGVTLVTQSNTADATTLATHIRVKSNLTVSFSNLVVPDSADGYRVTNEVQFRALDEDMITQLEEYEYVGDLTAPLTDDSMIIVADSINNTKKFKYEVGDTIEIATISKRNKAVDANLSGITLLREQLECYEFEYHTYTIAAIIYDIPTLKMPIYLSEASYEVVTGEEVTFDNIQIYVDQSLTAAEVLELESELKSWGTYYGNVKVTNTHSLFYSLVNEDKQYDEIFTLVAILLLCISPMIWFFSQMLYYLKRENEFTILQSIGAMGSDIRKLYLVGGIFMGVLSFIFCIGLGYLLSYLLYHFVNVTIPSLTLSYIRYEFYMPWYAIVLSVVMSVACGFLSAYLPYVSYMRRKSKTLAVEESGVSA
ncbi:MAG: hypothetical protein LUD44_08240 [Firmicutes bacterium]|nr:hypothetical protein [Bacillota bacterium]